MSSGTVGRSTRAKGNAGEDAAAEYLVGRGFDVVGRNFSAKANFHGGEIDIVARKGNVVHFIEVKARATDAFGCGREAVTAAKQRTIRRMATAWLLRTKLFDAVDVSFDVIEISGGVVELYENAF